MMERPVAVRIMEELAKGKQVGYLGSLRKTDASTVVDYIHRLERRCAAAEADRDALRAALQLHPEPDAERA